MSQFSLRIWGHALIRLGRSYLTELESAHIFVGIYKKEYGWVASDMNISGVEDEFVVARTSNLPRLVYIQDDADGRDPRLQALLDQVRDNSEIVFSRFDEPSELYDRIRDDVEKIVTDRFLAGSAVADIIGARGIDVLGSAIPPTHHQLSREHVIAGLLEVASRTSLLRVEGEMGVGKTIALAQLADQNGFHYVDAEPVNDFETPTVSIY